MKKNKLTNKEKEQLIIENFREKFNTIKRIDENPLEPMVDEEVEYVGYQINNNTNEVELKFNSSTLGEGYYSVPFDAEEIAGMCPGSQITELSNDMDMFVRTGEVGRYLDNCLNMGASKYIINLYNSGRISSEELFGGQDGLEYDDYRM